MPFTKIDIYYLKCDNCNTITYEASKEQAEKNGWEITGNKCYCPKCANKIDKEKVDFDL